MRSRALRASRNCLSCLVLILLGTNTIAHDLWLIPPEKPKQNQTVLVLAHSGMEFPVSEHAVDPSRFKQRILRLPDETNSSLKAAGTRDQSGLMEFTPSVQGIYQLGIQTTPKIITLQANEFNHYLVSDGLPHIYHLRFKEKLLATPAAERYSKSPKALLQIGSSNQGDIFNALGLTLEIVPQLDPFKLKVGQTLPVLVLFLNKPLADAHLGWDHPGDGVEHSGMIRTNSQGIAYIPITQTGLMTIRLTHMTRPRTSEYEWESFWTSLTYRVPS